MQVNKLLWLDMEMTGLNPKMDVPIEIAAVVTTSNLDEVDHFQRVIWQPDSKLEQMSPFVREMHTMNGLLEKVKCSTLSINDVEKSLMKFIVEHFVLGDAILCGSSIHVDRTFIKEYMPMIDRYLHYRMIDVSSFKEIIKCWYGEDAAADFHGNHTALSDIYASIRELKYYQNEVFLPIQASRDPMRYGIDSNY